ncbi:MAG: ferritin family protein [Clostridiaceae bacterium]|nr:ferritin family protein [Clostridiaceae bacterium]
MSVNWDGSKLFKTIVLNETKVTELYRELAKEAKDGKGSKFFENMAADEARHIKIYSAFLNNLPDQGNVELSEEDAEYMDLLIKTNMFDDSEDTIAKVRKIYTNDQVYNLAEKIEKDGILFINELVRLFPDVYAANTKEIDAVMKEEKTHLSMVLNRKAESIYGSLML